VRERRGHFAAPSLVASQFDALEEPAPGEGPYLVVPVPTHTGEGADRVAEAVGRELAALGLPLG